MLVKTLVPREEEDDEIGDGVQCYVPGIVQVVPLRKAPATKCYTILRYNGKKVCEAFISELGEPHPHPIPRHPRQCSLENQIIGFNFGPMLEQFKPTIFPAYFAGTSSDNWKLKAERSTYRVTVN